MIAIIDYGAGNLFSVKNALDFLGLENKITNSAADLSAADRLMLSDTFSDRRVVEAENGKRAIEEFEKNKDKLCAVLLDIMMPVMDGFGVLEYLVDNKYIDDIPVFIISADTSDKSLSRAYDLGAADVIAKPFNIRFVRRRINNIIELYDQRRYLSMLVKEKGIEVPFMKVGSANK